MEGLFAGLDVSTQSCKLVVIDLEKVETLHVDLVNYDGDLPHYDTEGGSIRGLGEGVSESDPAMWIEAVEILFGRLVDSGVRTDAVRAISVSGQQHGLVALTGDGDLARPRSKLWNDFSTTEECRILTDAVGGEGAMIDAVGNSQRTGYTAAKILHMLRHEPECYESAATLFLVHNFINWYLTGGRSGGVRVMEPGDTSGMALWHPGTREWSREVMEVISPDLHKKLPPVTPSDATIGAVSAELAERFGFSPACRIDAGSGDNMYGAIGTGNFKPGIVTVSLGTSGTAYTFMEEPFIDPTGQIAAFCDSTGHHLPLLCVSNMANGYEAVLNEYGLSHEEFDSLIGRTVPGNGGRLLMPWYEGERTPDLPFASAVYFGFRPEDFTSGIMCRAVLEGHVLNLYTGFARMPVETTAIHLTGGLSNSPSWCQVIADVFETETVPVSGEGAAVGAALHAAWVWHREKGNDYTLGEVAAPFVVMDEGSRKKPVPENLEVHRLQKRLYRALSNRVRGLQGEDPFELRAELLRLL